MPTHHEITLYESIAPYLKQGQCWRTGFEGTNCIKPKAAGNTLNNIIIPILEGKKLTDGGNPLYGGCNRSPANILNLQSPPTGEQAAANTIYRGPINGKKARNLPE